MIITEAQLVAGRKPLGPALVEHLDGSTSAKERLELILETLSGQVTVVAACQILGISEAMFYKLRNRVLQICLEDLEPKPRGRPPQLSSAGAERSAEVTTLQRELAAQTVRLELAQQLPQLAKRPGAVKKTNRLTSRKKQQRRRSK